MLVIVLGRMAAAGLDILRANLPPDCELRAYANAAEAVGDAAAVERAEVIVGGAVSSELARAAVRLKLFHAARAGLDGSGIERLPASVHVANTYHHEDSIAEYILMAMLYFVKRPAAYDRALREGQWDGSCIWGETPSIPVLEGSAALVIGTGHIARAFAIRARAFGVRVFGVSRKPEGAPPNFERIAGYENWRELLPESDFIIPACPLAPQTRGLIGGAEFVRMKASAVLINTARAEIVDESALYEALRKRAIAGAALDVWYRYPKRPEERCAPSNFPMHELDNVLLTPHVSGWTRQTVEGRMRDVAEDIARVRAGLTPKNLVIRD